MTDDNNELLTKDHNCPAFYLSRQQAASYLTQLGLPIAAATLAKQAVRGDGCPYVTWNGRVLYASGDLRKWAQQRMSAPLLNSAQRGQTGKKQP